MSTPAVDLADYVRIDFPTMTCYVSTMPESPDSCVVFSDIGGVPIFNTGETVHECNVQMRVRSYDYEDGYEIMRTVLRHLELRSGLVVDDIVYLIFRPASEPTFMGLDAKRRSHFAVTLHIVMQQLPVLIT